MHSRGVDGNLRVGRKPALSPPVVSTKGRITNEVTMFLTLQFPFADLRHFLGSETGRLNAPKISSPKVYGRDFIRSSGLIKRRPKGGIKEWPGEEVFADGALGLRFPNHLRRYKFGNLGFNGVVNDTFRRFHSDDVVARFEIGLEIGVTRYDEISPDGGDFMDFLRDVFTIPMHERYRTREKDKGQKFTKERSSEVSLFNAGKLLAQHYLVATTTRKADPPIDIKPWWLSEGTPAVFVEYPLSNRLVMPRYTKHILDVPEADAEVSYAWLAFQGKNFGVWFIGIKNPEKEYGIDHDARRRLRLNLTHLHAERECLSLVIANCGTEQGKNVFINETPELAEKFDEYFKRVSKAIYKPEIYGIPQLSFDAYDISFPGRIENLQDSHGKLLEKVQKYIEHSKNLALIRPNIGSVTVITINMGDFSITGSFNTVTAETITNSFNIATNSQAKSEIKDALKVLSTEVAKLAKDLPQVKADSVARKLHALTKEAVSSEPSEDLCAVSAKGILEAAKFVTELFAPIKTILTGLFTALGFASSLPAVI